MVSFPQSTIKTCPTCKIQFRPKDLLEQASQSAIPFSDLDQLCPNCVNSASKRNKSKYKVVNDYYYDENGNCVFTAAYHLNRGYCCRNNCRHCPY